MYGTLTTKLFREQKKAERVAAAKEKEGGQEDRREGKEYIEKVAMIIVTMVWWVTSTTEGSHLMAEGKVRKNKETEGARTVNCGVDESCSFKIVSCSLRLFHIMTSWQLQGRFKLTLLRCMHQPRNLAHKDFLAAEVVMRLP